MPELPDIEGLRQLRTLHRVMRRVLRVGSRRAAEGGELPKSYFHDHRRKGESCPQCEGKVKQATVGGRDVYAYFNNDAEGHAVRDAQALRKYLTQRSLVA